MANILNMNQEWNDQMMPGPASLQQVQEIMRANGGGGIAGGMGQAGGPMAQWNPNTLPGPATNAIMENLTPGATGGIGGSAIGTAPAAYASALANRQTLPQRQSKPPMMGTLSNMPQNTKIGKDENFLGDLLGGLGNGLSGILGWLGNNSGALLSNFPALLGLGHAIGNPGGMNMGQAINFGREAANVADPFASQRQQYQQQLQQLMTNPDSIQNNPAYQFRLNQGINALDRSAAAKGMLNSGNQSYDLTNYAQGLASQEYNNQLDRLATLSGATTGSPAAASQAMMQGLTSGYNMQNQRFTDIGSMLNSLLGARNAGSNLLGPLMSLLGGGGGQGMLGSLSSMFGGGSSLSDTLSRIFGGDLSNASEFDLSNWLNQQYPVNDTDWLNNINWDNFDWGNVDWGNFDWGNLANGF